MEIKISFDALDLSDFVEWDGEDTSIPSLSEVFRNEIRDQVVNKLFYKLLDDEIIRQVSEMFKGKVSDYLKTTAIDKAIEKVIENKISSDGNRSWPFRIDDIDDRVKKHQEKYMEELTEKLGYVLETKIEKATRQNLKFLYNLSMSRFIDVDKLTQEIQKNLYKIGEENGND